MRYIAAYILAKMGGNNSPTVNDIATIIGSVGVHFEEERANMLISQLHGKDLEEIMAQGNIIYYYNYLV